MLDSRRNGSYLVEFARRLLVARGWRASIFPNLPLTDRSWAILLVLFITSGKDEGVPVSDLMTYLADIPKSTFLDNLVGLVTNGHVTRTSDPIDGRRTLVFLTKDGDAKVRTLLSRMMEMLVSDLA